MIFFENSNEKPALVRLECVKKQLILTGFPRTIFATAKRRMQARIRRIKSEIQTHSLNGYTVIFQSFLASHFIQSIDPTPASSRHEMTMRWGQKNYHSRVLKLILKYLKAGVILPNRNYEETNKGVPQGGPLSPLLANILLDELDHELEKRGHQFVRYADDFVILCNSPRAGERIMASVKSYLEKSLKLIVNETKSKVVPLQEASFLGFQIIRSKIRWSEKSQKKFKAEVRRLTQRTRGHSPVKVIADLQSYLRGAVNYYAIGIPFGDIRALDSWLRRRMRLYYWKQWGRPRTRRRNLLKLGIAREEVHRASRARKGHWRMSQNELVRWAMNNQWLEKQGLLNLEKQWCSIRYPAGPKGAKG